jgi:phospholipid-translocating ATPase
MSQSTSDFKVEAGRIIFFGAINSIHSTVTVPKDRRKHDSKSKSESVALIARGYEAFASNKVSSAQYTILNFFPLQLLRQFSKMANLYFLFISILQLVPGWSPTGQYTTLGPLAIFVSLAMLREAIDDRKRHEQDAAENYALTSVLTVNRCPAEAPTARSLIPMSPVQKRDHLFQYYSKPASFATETKKWMDVRVGDIVLLEKDEPVLVDLLILKTSLEEATCFVETNSLDGESNLKQKKGIAVTLNLSEEELISVKGSLAVYFQFHLYSN